MTLTQQEMEDKLTAAYALGMEGVEISPLPAACCCPNGGEPKDGWIMRSAGCKIHGLRSNAPDPRLRSATAYR